MKRRFIRAIAITSGILTVGAPMPVGAQQQAPRVDRASLLVRSDIAYREGADSSQSLDLYVPNPRPSTLFPTVVFIHGGSLTSGDRRDLPYATICNNFVQAGMACASVNYRLVRQAAWPAAPQDVATADLRLGRTAPVLREWQMDISVARCISRCRSHAPRRSARSGDAGADRRVGADAAADSGERSTVRQSDAGGGETCTDRRSS